jgi:hypothetical protein
MSDTESEVEKAPKVVKKEKKKCTEEQLANLRKGMEVMKQKREALAKERVAVEEKKKKGELPLDTPLPKYVPKAKTKVVKPEVVEMAERPVITRERKPRVKQVTATDLEAMKTSILTALAPKKEEEKTVVKEVPVEKVVQKERIVSGSELLNKVFGF